MLSVLPRTLFPKFTWALPPPTKLQFAATCRARHSRASDRLAGAQQRQLLRGQQGSILQVRGPETFRGLRMDLGKARFGRDVMCILQKSVDDGGERAPGFAEFAKAMQRCGELRDLNALLQVWELARDRDVALSREAYSILITAAGRSARCVDGQVRKDIREKALKTGHSAWQWMQHDGHKPDVPHFGAALGLCAKVGDSAWAQELWTSMLITCKKAPSATEFSQYLEALMVEGSAEGWATIQREISNGRHETSEVLLSALTNAAAVNFQPDRVDWLWAHLKSKVKLNAVVYCALSKAKLLNGKAVEVLRLRPEMMKQGISLLFRTFTHELQALVLLLHQDPESGTWKTQFEQTAASALDMLESSCPAKPFRASTEERRQLKELVSIGKRLQSGELFPLAAIQVIRWPWKPEVAL